MIDREALPVLLEIDGGVSPANSGEIARAGARVFVAGSAVFGAAPSGAAFDERVQCYRRAMHAIRNAAEQPAAP